MGHKKECDFKSIIKELNEGSWIVGEGEISGCILIDENKIIFSDGWNNYPNIDFKFCPECGKKQ